MSWDEIEKRSDDLKAELAALVAAADDAEIGRAVRALLPSSTDPRMLAQQLVGWLAESVGEGSE